MKTDEKRITVPTINWNHDAGDFSNTGEETFCPSAIEKYSTSSNRKDATIVTWKSGGFTIVAMSHAEFKQLIGD